MILLRGITKLVVQAVNRASISIRTWSMSKAMKVRTVLSKQMSSTKVMEIMVMKRVVKILFNLYRNVLQKTQSS